MNNTISNQITPEDETELAVSLAVKKLSALNTPFSVAVSYDRGDGIRTPLYYGSNRPFRSASVIKLFIALVYLKECEKSGRFPEAATIRKLYDMITLSSNSATNYFISTLGFEKLNREIAAYGFSDTSVNRKMLDFEAVARGEDNFTSARDCVLFFDRLTRADFGQPVSEFLFCLTRSVRESGKLSLYMPDDILFAGKPGSLDPESDKGGVENDVGLFFDNNKSVSVAVFFSDVYLVNDVLGAISRFGFDILGIFFK